MAPHRQSRGRPAYLHNEGRGHFQPGPPVGLTTETLLYTCTRRHPAMSVPQLNDEHRGEEILAVFDTAFGELLAADPAAFRVKFRKMAASAFAFYRGTACLFYHDQTADIGFGSKRGGPFLDDRTSRVWIHGDLHAENFGTYMDATGRLIFNVNDFDEAHVGGRKSTRLN